MPFEVARRVLARVIRRVFDLPHDLGARGFRPRIVGVDIVDGDVDALFRLLQRKVLAQQGYGVVVSPVLEDE